MKRAGDLFRRGVVSVAEKRLAHGGRKIVDLRGREDGEAARFRFVDPVVLAEQHRAACDRLAGEQAAAVSGFTNLKASGAANRRGCRWDREVNSAHVLDRLCG